MRKRQEKSNLRDIEDFQEKVMVYQNNSPNQAVLTAFLSLDFTDEAQQCCEQANIAWVEEIPYF